MSSARSPDQDLVAEVRSLLNPSAVTAPVVPSDTTDKVVGRLVVDPVHGRSIEVRPAVPDGDAGRRSPELVHRAAREVVVRDVAEEITRAVGDGGCFVDRPEDGADA